MSKTKLHAELELRYKEYFESKLAVSLLDQRKLFAKTEKVSKAIYVMMNKYKNKILTIIASDEKIFQELYDKRYFGRLTEYSPDGENRGAERIWEDMQAILMQSQSLDKLMQIHSVFIYRIAKYISPSNLKPSTINLSDRGRTETHEQGCLSNQLGICNNQAFANLLRRKTYLHHRGKDRFRANDDSRFFKNMSAKNLPFSSGLSAHTATLITGAMQLGLKSDEEIKEYLLACFVFLAAGGNHSFHEVMSIGKQIGIDYEDGNYISCLPINFMNTDLFKELQTMFPDLLERSELEISDEEMAASVFGKSVTNSKECRM